MHKARDQNQLYRLNESKSHMPQNQINGVDETANVTVGFNRHNALI